MGEKTGTGIRRVVKAAVFSLAGLRAAWRNEAAFRQECVLTLLLTPFAFLIGETAVERSMLIGTCLLVLIAELINSAIESTVDRIGNEHHELAGRAKDLGSAGVFVSLVLVAIVWGLHIQEHFAG